MAKKKFYAVRIGRVPGVYETWAACQEQVLNYSGAIYKSFFNIEEAENFINGNTITVKNTNTSNNTDSIKIYVDGSFNGKEYGWGFAVFKNGEVIYTKNGAGSNPDYIQHRNIAGEVFAAAEAARWAKKQDFNMVIICHDYQGISEWAEGRWKTNNLLTQKYAAFMKDYRNLVKFEKVAGHTGVEGNELADKLAKQAIGL